MKKVFNTIQKTKFTFLRYFINGMLILSYYMNQNKYLIFNSM